MDNDYSIVLEAFNTAENNFKDIEFNISSGDFDKAYHKLIKKTNKVNSHNSEKSNDSHNEILDLDSTVIHSGNEIITMTYSLFDQKKNDLLILRNNLNDIERKRT